jgi:hypothetical protein
MEYTAITTTVAAAAMQQAPRRSSSSRDVTGTKNHYWLCLFSPPLTSKIIYTIEIREKQVLDLVLTQIQKGK